MPLQQKNPAIAGFFVEEGDEAKLRRQPSCMSRDCGIFLLKREAMLKLRRHHWSDSLFVPRLRDFLVEEGGDAKASSAPLE
jgi:hypothetical protein